MWKNVATAAWPRYKRDAILEASVLTTVVAVCAYVAAVHENILLSFETLLLAALYLTAPFCWLMPLTLRRAHLALWLALVLAKWTVGVFTLWGDGLILYAVTIAGRILWAVLDALFLLNGILAVRASSTDWQPLKGPNRTHDFFRGDTYYVRRMWDYFVEHLAAVRPPEAYDLNSATASDGAR